MADTTFYFLARSGVGPNGACIAKRRFPRLLGDDFVDMVDFLSYAHDYHIIHDHGGDSMICRWTTDQECYDKYFNSVNNIPDGCVSATLAGTLNKMGEFALLNDNSLGCIHAREIFDTLGLTDSQINTFVPNVTWLEVKSFSAKLDSGIPVVLYSDEDIVAMGLESDL